MAQKQVQDKKRALLAVTTHGRPWYFALSLAYLAEADTRGYEVRLYIDGEGDPLNVKIAEQTNAKHHIFDRIIRCKGNLGCQPLRNKIFHDFKAGDWDYLAYCDDDLIYGRSVFQDMLRTLGALRSKDKRYHFAVGYVNESVLRKGLLKPPLFRSRGRVYTELIAHGGAMWVGTREGWLAIRPEPWTIGPDGAGFMARLAPCITRSGMKTGVCLKPFPHVQHICNAHTEISGWKSGWRGSFAIDLMGRDVRVPSFCHNCFTLHDEQFGGLPEGTAMFIRTHIKRLGNKVWLPQRDYEGYKQKPPKHEIRHPDPPPMRLEVMPDGKPVSVLISIPTRPETVHHRLSHRLMQWVQKYDIKSGGEYQITTTFHPGIRYPDMVRTRQLQTFLSAKEGFEWLLTVDDDIVPPLDILDMIKYGKDVVQAPAVVLVNGMFEWVGKRYHNQQSIYDQTFERFFHMLNGHDLVPVTLTQNLPDGKKGADYNTMVPVPKPYPRGLYPVDTIGTGCLLVRRCVIETLGVARHRTEYDELVNMKNTHDGVFSECVHDAGIEMWCDTGRRCEHWHSGHEMSTLYDVVVRGMYDRQHGTVRDELKLARLPEPRPAAPKGLRRIA